MTRDEPPPLTAARIEEFLERRYVVVGNRTIAVPNVTALGHESDFLVMTDRRFVLEIEVKVSIADFRADLRGKPLSPKWMRQEVMRAAAERRPIPAGWRGWRYREVPENPEPISDRDEARELMGRGQAWMAPACPNRFAYAYPVELHDQIAEEAPAWAGLMPYDRSGFRAHRKVDGSFFSEGLDRAPKLLHKAKASDKVRDDMLFSTYHRFWRERRVRVESQRAREYLAQQLQEACA